MPNSNTDDVIMLALAKIMPGVPPNTAFASVSGAIYIEDMAALAQGKFPALHLEAGQQQHLRNSNGSWEGQVVIKARYFDRWDEQQATLDSVRKGIKNDLRTMMANIQENDSLTLYGAIHATSVAKIQLSAYSGGIDTRSCPGLTLVYQDLLATFNILPYDQ